MKIASGYNRQTRSQRDAIVAGEFKEHLPGVRKLSRDLHVGIPTILGAIKVLEGEGLLQSAPGKRTCVIPGKTRPQQTRDRARQVVFITFASNWIAGSHYYQSVLNELSELAISVRVFELERPKRNTVPETLQELVIHERA